VIIDAKGEDNYLIEVLLDPNETLTLEELKEKFQILDLSPLDETNVANDIETRSRKHAGLILRLADVFTELSTFGCIHHILQEKKSIQVNNLQQEINDAQSLVNLWNELWKKVDEMPHLALFSRSYLLHLTDLIRKHDAREVSSILRMILPSASGKLENSVFELVQLVHGGCQFGIDECGSVSAENLLYILQELHKLVQLVYCEKRAQLNTFYYLKSFGETLNSYFNEKPIVILNVPRDLVAGSALAAYISFTGRQIEPGRILFVTANTSQEEVKRFMTLWSFTNYSADELFIIVHIERLSASLAGVIRDAVGTVLPEKQKKLLLLAQQQHRVQATKSLGARLGLVSDRLLDENLFTSSQLRECLSMILPRAANINFFTSILPGCGKSQQVMRLASDLVACPGYYRIPIRMGTVEELLESVEKVKDLSRGSRDHSIFLHFDGEFIYCTIINNEINKK